MPTLRGVAIGLVAIWALGLLVGVLQPAWAQSIFFVQVLSLSLFAFAHGAERYGFGKVLALMLLMNLSVHAFENLSIVTGVPFGHFEHTAAMGPKLFHVPLIVGFAYFSAGYLGWVLAASLLGAIDRERGWLPLVGVPVIATLITTAWDACIDPLGGTVARNWIWHDGGGYYGVPLSNYIGWIITCYVAFQLFALLLRSSGPEQLGRVSSALWWALPAVQFGIMGLQYPLSLWLLPDVEVADPTGQLWRTGDIYEGMTIVSIFTMALIALLGMMRAGRVARQEV